MKSRTIVRDYSSIVRETATAVLLAVLFLVTGCGSSENYTPRAELAPPPPVGIMMAADYFGPPLPFEFAMLQNLENISPASGIDFAVPRVYAGKCHTDAFEAQDGRLGFGFGTLPKHDTEMSFARMHSGRDAPEMTVSFTIPLSSPRNIRCR